MLTTLGVDQVSDLDFKSDFRGCLPFYSGRWLDPGDVLKVSCWADPASGLERVKWFCEAVCDRSGWAWTSETTWLML